MLGRIAGKGLPLQVVIEYFSLNLAWILALAVPMAVLIATLSAFGRLASDGEITALRASGISPVRLMRPVMVAAFFVTLSIGYFNNFLLPDLNHRTKLLLADISRKRPTFNIEPGIFNFTIPKHVIKAEVIDSQTSSLKDITIYDEHRPGERAVITAKTGHVKFVPEDEKFLLTLYKGEIHQPTNREPHEYEWTIFDSALFRVPAPGMLLKRGTSGYRSDRELTVPEMFQRVKQLEMKKGSAYDRRRIAAYMVEIHKKFSIPVACLVFVLLGAPLGVLSRKGGIAVSGGLALFFFTVYWVFLMAGEDLADRGLLSPAISMWMPNIILTAIGLWLIRIAQRRTSLPGVNWAGVKLQRLLKIEKNNLTGDGDSY